MTASINKDVEQFKLSYMLVQNDTLTLENNLAVSYKVKRTLII